MNENPFDGLNKADRAALVELRQAVLAFRSAWLESDRAMESLYGLGAETSGFEKLALEVRRPVRVALKMLWSEFWPKAKPVLPGVVLELLVMLPRDSELDDPHIDRDGDERVLWRQAWSQTSFEHTISRLAQVLPEGPSKRPWKRRSEEDVMKAFAVLIRNPEISDRALAEEAGIPRASLQRMDQVTEYRRLLAGGRSLSTGSTSTSSSEGDPPG